MKTKILHNIFSGTTISSVCVMETRVVAAPYPLSTVIEQKLASASMNFQ